MARPQPLGGGLRRAYGWPECPPGAPTTARGRWKLTGKPACFAYALHARRVAKLVVELGLAAEATVTLGWFPGDREARILDIATPGRSIAVAALARCVDLSLRYSGENFPVDDLAEVARWGHFENADRPWARMGKI